MSLATLHLDKLRLRHLRLLELIDRLGSLRAVAGTLNLTQPAVSQMLKDLEFAFGAALVDRSARGAVLSPAGRLALQRTRAGLATFEQLARELQADRLPVIRLGTNPALLAGLLPAALGRLATDGTRSKFQLSTGTVGDMVRALLDGRLDGYVGRVDWDQMPGPMADALSHQPLTTTDLVLACAADHPLARRPGLSVADLAGWAWALPGAGATNRMALEAELKNHGLPGPVVAVEVASDPFALMMLARQMRLLTLVPKSVLEPQLRSGDLCQLALPGLRLPLIHIGFLTLAAAEPMAALQALRQALTAEARGDPPLGPDTTGTPSTQTRPR